MPRREPATARSTRCVVLFLLAGVAARAVFAVNDGLLPNGHFEQGPDKSQLNGTRVMGRDSIPNWEISGFVEYIESGQKQDDMILPVPEGERAVRLGNDATIRQQLSVTRHTYYSITFGAARTCAQAEKLNVSVTPEFGVLPIQTVYTSSGWDSYSWAFKAKHSTVWLSIHNPGHEDDPACGPLIDSVAIKALRPPHQIKYSMLRNGDFENGPYIFPNTPWGVLVPPILEDEHSPLPGWTIMSDTKVVKYVDAAHHAVPKGAGAVELVAGRECALVQEVSTEPQRSYRLSFSVGDAANGCEGYLAVDAYAARATLKVTYESHGTGGHKRAELVFEAVAEQTRVVFHSSNHHMKSDATLCGPIIDDISLVPVHAARRLRM
ncbi:BIIDXI-like protein At5g11420 [Phragmites australis]|uniref:BIIDXI-like protein At5g11420 n=1 Tax=Phragmites australis TaxID=29695 RepID=UPI002D772042|nr:BIIDXI-like protein At5g11420 [Phragmites australis]